MHIKLNELDRIYFLHLHITPLITLWTRSPSIRTTLVCALFKLSYQVRVAQRLGQFTQETMSTYSMHKARLSKDTDVLLEKREPSKPQDITRNL
jgi:hypothetical protein